MKRKVHPNSRPKWQPVFQDRMPAVPRGWRAKLEAYYDLGMGGVFTKEECRQLAIVTGVREAGLVPQERRK